jgi:hypothetical protein
LFQGLSLHKNIEGGLDDGTIVIIPAPQGGEEEIKWLCVLVNESKRNDTFSHIVTPGFTSIRKWKVSVVFLILTLLKVLCIL